MKNLHQKLAFCFSHLCLAFVFALFFSYRLLTQESSLGKEAVILVEQGESLASIAEKLERHQIVPQATEFRFFAILQGYAKKIRYGEYAFSAHMNLHEVISHMASGKTILHKFLVKEGDTVSDIKTRLAQLDRLKGPLPESTPEGILLPETYYYSFGDKRNDLIARMNQSMQDTLKELWPHRAHNLPFSTQLEALTLASIVEKETGLPEERPRVASVFINRLRQGIPLQADPTIIYAMTKGESALERALLKKDLSYPSPYNTYIMRGLPPGPICNPGRASIEAVLKPLQTNDLYFVANGEGGHNFAESLDAHNKNVNIWRKKSK